MTFAYYLCKSSRRDFSAFRGQSTVKDRHPNSISCQKRGEGFWGHFCHAEIHKTGDRPFAHVLISFASIARPRVRAVIEFEPRTTIIVLPSHRNGDIEISKNTLSTLFPSARAVSSREKP